MTSYCQVGNKSRITLSDGRVFNVDDCPVTIQVEEFYGGGADYTLTLIKSDGTTQNYWRQSLGVGENIINVGVVRDGIFVPVPLNIGYENIYALLSNGTFKYFGWIWGYNVIHYALFNHTTNQWNQPTKKIKITGNNNVVILEENFDGTYLVECIESCPEGTIDCGDCCLNCKDIYNQLSDIRRLISQLK